ncbi:hypothetical protein AB0I58_31175, partial [Spirillospora sp. NPDC050365]
MRLANLVVPAAFSNAAITCRMAAGVSRSTLPGARVAPADAVGSPVRPVSEPPTLPGPPGRAPSTTIGFSTT